MWSRSTAAVFIAARSAGGGPGAEISHDPSLPPLVGSGARGEPGAAAMVFLPDTDDAPPLGCGNAQLTPDEGCDDGNTVSGDGCSANCLVVELGFSCSWAGQLCLPIARCGDGRVTAPESCDDGNRAEGDGCAPNCRVEALRAALSLRRASLNGSEGTCQRRGGGNLDARRQRRRRVREPIWRARGAVDGRRGSGLRWIAAVLSSRRRRGPEASRSRSMRPRKDDRISCPSCRIIL
jgi:cysteine-rich repeat protein